MWGPLKTWLVGSIATQRVLRINGWDSKTAVCDGICVKPKSYVLLIYLSLAHLFMATFCSSFYIQVDSVCATGWHVQTRRRLNQIGLPFYTKLHPTSTTQLGLGLVCLLPFSDKRWACWWCVGWVDLVPLLTLLFLFPSFQITPAITEF